jgi:hypothetical protein
MARPLINNVLSLASPSHSARIAGVRKDQGIVRRRVFIHRTVPPRLGRSMRLFLPHRLIDILEGEFGTTYFENWKVERQLATNANRQANHIEFLDALPFIDAYLNEPTLGGHMVGNIAYVRTMQYHGQ